MARPSAEDACRWYGDAKTLRRPHENDWRMASAYCLPRHYQSWTTDGFVMPADTSAVRRFAYDSTGVNALPKYAAILNRLATPESQRWHKLRATNQNLMKLYSVRTYFDTLTELLFTKRYETRARFVQTTGEVYTGLGAYGSSPFTITWRKPSLMDRRGGFMYKAWPLRDCFVLVDDFGIITHVFRRFYLNARQFRAKFPKDQPPPCVAVELNKPVPAEGTYFEFVQMLCTRSELDYDPNALDARRHPIQSLYICVQDKQYVGGDEGFTSWPLMLPRTFTEPGDVYGYSPALQALAAMGGVSAMKKTVLKQGQKAVDPPLLANDDGVLSGKVDIRPGRVNYGGVNQAGQPLVHALQTGNFQVAEKLIEDERRDIQDAFFVTLFTILTEAPQKTATQVMEEIAEKAALLAPTMGRLQSEMLGPSIEREIALLAEHGELPDPPGELIEAKGEYSVTYTSPLAKGQFAEEVSGFMRWYEMLSNAAQIIAAAGGTELPTDWANLDVAAPEIADFMSVRTSWVNDTKAVNIIRKGRAEAQTQSELIKQAPAAAAIGKEMLKNGGGIPGVSN